jgi:hypothetical protein
MKSYLTTNIIQLLRQFLLEKEKELKLLEEGENKQQNLNLNSLSTPSIPIKKSKGNNELIPNNAKRMKKDFPPKMIFKSNFGKLETQTDFDITTPISISTSPSIGKSETQQDSSPTNSQNSNNEIIITPDLYELKRVLMGYPLNTSIYVHKYLGKIYFQWNEIRRILNFNSVLKAPYQVSNFIKKYFKENNIPEIKFMQKSIQGKYKAVELNDLLNFLDIELKSSHKNINKVEATKLILKLREDFHSYIQSSGEILDINNNNNTSNSKVSIKNLIKENNENENENRNEGLDIKHSISINNDTSFFKSESNEPLQLV